MARRATRRLIPTLLVTHNVEIKTAIKQAILPSKVLPPAFGILCLPQIFPTRLASPSPKERA